MSNVKHDPCNDFIKIAKHRDIVTKPVYIFLKKFRHYRQNLNKQHESRICYGLK